MARAIRLEIRLLHVCIETAGEHRSIAQAEVGQGARIVLARGVELFATARIIARRIEFRGHCVVGALWNVLNLDRAHRRVGSCDARGRERDEQDAERLEHVRIPYLPATLRHSTRDNLDKSSTIGVVSEGCG